MKTRKSSGRPMYMFALVIAVSGGAMVFIAGCPIPDMGPACTADADCDDSNACTADSCGVDGNCVHDPEPQDGLTCDDDELCTEIDVCSDGACFGTAK